MVMSFLISINESMIAGQPKGMIPMKRDYAREAIEIIKKLPSDLKFY